MYITYSEEMLVYIQIYSVLNTQTHFPNQNKDNIASLANITSVRAQRYYRYIIRSRF